MASSCHHCGADKYVINRFHYDVGGRAAPRLTAPHRYRRRAGIVAVHHRRARGAAARCCAYHLTTAPASPFDALILGNSAAASLA